MNRNSRLSGTLHVLLHLAESREPVTSERLALAMDTNPVVIRRIMAGLKEEGYVSSEKGRGGGWILSCDLASVTLRDVHQALGLQDLLAIDSRSENPACLVEQAVNAALEGTFREAEALILDRFGRTTLAALSADFHSRLSARGGSLAIEDVHAA